MKEIGKLTEDEHRELFRIRNLISEKLRKIGEYHVLQSRVSNEILELEKEGQSIMSLVTERLGLESNDQWVALNDGTIRGMGVSKTEE